MLFLYSIPCIVALITKFIIIWGKSSILHQANIWFIGLFIAFFGANILELTSYLYFIEHHEHGLLMLSPYYMCITTISIFLLGLSLDIAGSMNKRRRNFLLFLCFSLNLFVSIPGPSIAGVASIGYSITRIPGKFYIFTKLGIVVPALLAAVVMLKVSITNKGQLKHRKNLVLIIAFSPIIFLIIATGIMMEFNIKVNVAMTLPLLVNITLWIMLYTEQHERRFIFLSKIPGTRENNQMRKLSMAFLNRGDGLEHARALFEQTLIHDTIDLCSGNKSEAARHLNISRSTLLRKIGEL